MSPAEAALQQPNYERAPVDLIPSRHLTSVPDAVEASPNISQPIQIHDETVGVMVNSQGQSIYAPRTPENEHLMHLHPERGRYEIINHNVADVFGMLACHEKVRVIAGAGQKSERKFVFIQRDGTTVNHALLEGRVDEDGKADGKNKQAARFTVTDDMGDKHSRVIPLRDIRALTYSRPSNPLVGGQDGMGC